MVLHTRVWDVSPELDKVERTKIGARLLVRFRRLLARNLCRVKEILDFVASRFSDWLSRDSLLFVEGVQGTLFGRPWGE